MATSTPVSTEWILSPENNNYYRVEWRADGKYRYIWLETYQLPQCPYHREEDAEDAY